MNACSVTQHSVAAVKTDTLARMVSCGGRKGAPVWSGRQGQVSPQHDDWSARMDTIVDARKYRTLKKSFC